MGGTKGTEIEAATENSLGRVAAGGDKQEAATDEDKVGTLRLFVRDAEGLRALASEPVLRRGLKYFADQRVIDLGWEDERAWASVEGSRRNEPYTVELSLEDGGELRMTCDCPVGTGDGDQSTQPAVCKHVIATLAACAARVAHADEREEEFSTAAQQAVAERVQRGRTEVKVKHVGGDLDFGTWTAESLRPSGASLYPYRVQIRSTTEHLNHCTCPDFAVNTLGT